MTIPIPPQYRPPTYVEFLESVARTLARVDDFSATWRLGQTYFNVLYDNRPELAETVRGTELDPFHDDQRVPALLTWLAQVWDEPPKFDTPTLRASLDQWRRGEVVDL